MAEWQHFWDERTDTCKRCGAAKATAAETGCRPLPPAADDFPTISRRVKELEAERVERWGKG